MQLETQPQLCVEKPVLLSQAKTLAEMEIHPAL